MSGVLLLLVGLIIVYYAFTFLGTGAGALQGQASRELGAKIIEIQSTFTIVEQEGAYIFIKNTGATDIEEGTLVVYLDDVGTNAYISEDISSGETNIMVIYNWNVIPGPAGTKAKLVVPGKLMSQSKTVVKPEEL